MRAELRDIVRPRLVIGVGVGKFAKAALMKLYPEGQEMNWPFRVPRARRSDPPDTTYLLFPPHPYWIMTRSAPIREQYVRRLDRERLLAHDEVLRTAIEAHDGFLFSHTGDGVDHGCEILFLGTRSRRRDRPHRLTVAQSLRRARLGRLFPTQPWRSGIKRFLVEHIVCR